MSKMVLGKNAENEKLTLLQTVENCFGQLGQNAENDVHNTLRLYFCEKCLKEIKIGIQV
jgi:light-regulated signal transduction histidine kinase (bacteriophytochrome)